MSNGENVVDSWEEIDEVDLEKSLQNFKTESRNITSSTSLTPTIAKSIVKPPQLPTQDFRPMKLLQRQGVLDNYKKTSDLDVNNALHAPTARDELSALDNMETTFKPVIMMLHNTNDEYQSANYTAPIANQTVKILRRPTQKSEAERRNGMAKPKQPIKTLQQREQEYAEARLRIMGSAKNPEDDLANTEKLKKLPAATATSATAATTGLKPLNLDMPSTSTSVGKEKLDGNVFDQSFQSNNLLDISSSSNSSNMSSYGGSVHENLCSTNYMQPQYSQNFGYPNAPTCTELYQNRSMTIMAMPQPSLLQAQNYQHLNSGMFPIHQQQNRQYPKQYSVPSQPIQKPWPTILGGIPLQQSQNNNNNKVAFMKNNKKNNNNNNNSTSQNSESIVRVPRGPDGSQGFQVRR